jgi:disulfide bond formation protein DsbB
VYAVLILLAGLLGASVAARHVWIQNLPADQVPDCGPGLDYMLEVFPVTETLQMVLSGSGECAEISWSFLSLSMPAWALLWFVGLAFFGLLNNLPSREAVS